MKRVSVNGMALNKAVLSEGYPMGYIGGLSNEFYRRVVQ